MPFLEEIMDNDEVLENMFRNGISTLDVPNQVMQYLSRRMILDIRMHLSKYFMLYLIRHLDAQLRLLQFTKQQRSLLVQNFPGFTCCASTPTFQFSIYFEVKCERMRENRFKLRHQLRKRRSIDCRFSVSALCSTGRTSNSIVFLYG